MMQIHTIKDGGGKLLFIVNHFHSKLEIRDSQEVIHHFIVNTGSFLEVKNANEKIMDRIEINNIFDNSLNVKQKGIVMEVRDFRGVKYYDIKHTGLCIEIFDINRISISKSNLI